MGKTKEMRKIKEIESIKILIKKENIEEGSDKIISFFFSDYYILRNAEILLDKDELKKYRKGKSEHFRKCPIEGLPYSIVYLRSTSKMYHVYIDTRRNKIFVINDDSLKRFSESQDCNYVVIRSKIIKSSKFRKKIVIKSSRNEDFIYYIGSLRKVRKRIKLSGLGNSEGKKGSKKGNGNK